MRLPARMLTIAVFVISMAPMPLLHGESAIESSNKATRDAASSIAPQGPGVQPVTSTAVPHKRHRTPKAELFLGYSRFGTFGNNTVTGNRMVGLNGGNASIAFNFNHYLGLVGDFGGYDDSQLQLVGNGANQPIVTKATGTAYTYLFGPRFSFRNETRFTPFAQVLAGGVHASPATVTSCIGSACALLPVQNSFAMTGGGGLDIRLTRRISIRAIQAEYMLTRFTSVANGVSTGVSASQNDLRLSAGLLFAFGGREPRLPVQLSCSVQPVTVFAGDPVTATATATNLSPKRKVFYSWTTSGSGGAVNGTDATATISTAGLAPGAYTVSGHVSQGDRPDEQAGCTAGFTVQPFGPPSISCSATPSNVMSGDGVTITAQATSPQNRPLSYSYTASAGSITGTTPTAILSTTGAGPGTILVTCDVVDDLGKSAAGTTRVSVNALPVAAAPQTSPLCAISFDRDRKRPARVDNEAKACLDDIALQLQRESAGKLVIVGNYGDGETPKIAAERATNERSYLTDEKGVDAGRVELRVGIGSGRTASNTFVPAGATFNEGDSTPIPQP